ncbi:MAG TPA: carbonic anhydrase [Polyangiaceae bacterium]|nr:carbonic anhydrase [Polyangiaceae bacterium]
MKKIIDGVHRFQKSVFSPRKEFFQRLAHEQRPEALFVTCSDSRIHPQLITQSEPGELFILRNAGNLIPAYGVTSGEAATIEFAIRELGVRHLIVCGHTGCGAMKALLRIEDLPQESSVRCWLGHAESTRRVVREMCQGLDGEAMLRAAVQENVLVQIENLKTHPAVRSGLARGSITIHGWMYELETGRMLEYDPEHGRFERLDQRPSAARAAIDAPRLQLP